MTSEESVFALCRSDAWEEVLRCVRRNPTVATKLMVMQNNITTTVLHQAITSKSDANVRARTILYIIQVAPSAASMKNGYGSLPLHVLMQRNVKMNSSTKERLIHALVNAYTQALVEQGGVGKRTPLHIAFTDYISPQLARSMIELGPSATFMKDKKGFLPIHVACSRHCSPEKLEMLLDINPSSLYETTNDGQTPLALAISTATKSHPNFRLIEKLQREEACNSPTSSQTIIASTIGVTTTNNFHRGRKIQISLHSTTTSSKEAKNSPSAVLDYHDHHPPVHQFSRCGRSKRRKVEEVVAANLLLDFHRTVNCDSPQSVAQV
mmetsp:Transcript_23373/g.32748  ORF Transcript_23373/g.32748 Transcript_23373/m.32748 type:complete len:323 (-) Transcript_23373:505-1473(-)